MALIQPGQIAFMTSLDFVHWKPRDVAGCLAEIGYGGVEWTLPFFDPRETTAEDRRALVQISRDHGLLITELVLQTDLVHPEAGSHEDVIAFVTDCIEAAAAMGVSAINMLSGPKPWMPAAPRLGRDLSEGEAWDRLKRNLDACLPVAEKCGVYLAVEAVWGNLVRDYYTMQEMLRVCDHPYLAVNMDPSHYVLYGNDIGHAVRQLASRIKHVHLKDVIGKPGMCGESFTFPHLGTGIMDWPAFFTVLNDIGYTGGLSVEFEVFDYYRKVLKQDPARAAAMAMEQVRALAGLGA